MWTRHTFIDSYIFIRWTVLLLLGAANLLACDGKQVKDYDQARRLMVDKQIVLRGVENPRVVRAMLKVPRHLFIPEPYRHYAYADSPVPIGYEQTISQPYIVALMTEQVAPDTTHRVLEIGTGSGYQAAVLAELAREVYTIEIVEPLGRRAGETLAALGYKNVKVKIGDGYEGWPEHAPFDAIIVTCAPTAIPEPLIAQLKEGGTMIIPVGTEGFQYLYRVKKAGGEVRTEKVIPVSFVPLTGPHAK